MLYDDNIKIFNDKDYFAVKDKIWKFFFAIYGGGPSIKITSKQLDKRLSLEK